MAGWLASSLLLSIGLQFTPAAQPRMLLVTQIAAVQAAMNQSHASAELFYRLESLIAQGFLVKRRILEEGQFCYRLTEEFSVAMSEG